jgi:hypothetical protein
MSTLERSINMMQRNNDSSIYGFKTPDAVAFEEHFEYHSNDLTLMTVFLQKYNQRHTLLLHPDDIALIQDVVANSTYLKSVMLNLVKTYQFEVPQGYDFRGEMFEVSTRMVEPIRSNGDAATLSILKLAEVNDYLKSAIAKYHKGESTRGGFWKRVFTGQSN